MRPLAEEPRPLGVVGAPAVGSDLARRDQLLQRVAQGRRLVERAVADVELVEVEVVGVQAAQARLAGAAQIPRRGVAAVALALRLVEDVAELGRQHHPVPPARERAPDDPLAVSRAVDIGGVEEGHAEVERAADRADRLVVVHRAPAARLPVAVPLPADRPAPQAERADLDPAAAQRSGECGRFCRHRGLLLDRPSLARRGRDRPADRRHKLMLVGLQPAGGPAQVVEAGPIALPLPARQPLAGVPER